MLHKATCLSSSCTTPKNAQTLIFALKPSITIKKSLEMCYTSVKSERKKDINVDKVALMESRGRSLVRAVCAEVPLSPDVRKEGHHES